MAPLQHRRRNKIDLHYSNRLKYSDLNEGGLTKTVKSRRDNNKCCQVKMIFWESVWINIENERKKKSVGNLKICVRFWRCCLWAWVSSWMRETHANCVRLTGLLMRLIKTCYQCKRFVAYLFNLLNCWNTSSGFENKRYLYQMIDTTF